MCRGCLGAQAATPTAVLRVEPRWSQAVRLAAGGALGKPAATASPLTGVLNSTANSTSCALELSAGMAASSCPSAIEASADSSPHPDVSRRRATVPTACLSSHDISWTTLRSMQLPSPGSSNSRSRSRLGASSRRLKRLLTRAAARQLRRQRARAAAEWAGLRRSALPINPQQSPQLLTAP